MKWRCTSSTLTCPAGILPYALKTHPMEPKMPSLSSHRFLPFVQTAWVQSYLCFALPSPLWGWQLCVSSFPCCFVAACLSEQRAGELRDACHPWTDGSAGLLSQPAAEPCLQVTAMQTYANASAAAYVTALPPLEFPVSPRD